MRRVFGLSMMFAALVALVATSCDKEPAAEVKTPKVSIELKSVDVANAVFTVTSTDAEELYFYCPDDGGVPTNNDIKAKGDAVTGDEVQLYGLEADKEYTAYVLALNGDKSATDSVTFKTKAEEAKRAEEQKQAIQKQKMADLQDILDQFAAWFQEYYNINAGDELKAESVMEIIDGIQEYMDALKGLEMVIGKKPAVKVIKSNTKPSADDTINQFLKQMGW